MQSHTFLAGRNFNPKLVDSFETDVIVNEEVIRCFNIAGGKVSDAVGQTVQVDGKELAIVEVIKNFEYRKGSNQTGKEVIMRFANAEANYLNVKIQSRNLLAIYVTLEAIWEKLDPVHLF